VQKKNFFEAIIEWSNFFALDQFDVR
jgi:hypothetical protein